MFLHKIRNIFCVPDTKFVSATNVARAGKRGNICVRSNVSSFARAVIDFTLSNTRRFYSSKGDHLGVKGSTLHQATKKFPYI